MTPPLLGVRVLIAEDHLDSRDFLCLGVTQAGGTPVCVDSVAAAVKKAREWRPDVLVSNLGMHPDGLTVVRAVEQVVGGRIPSISVSGYTDERHRQRALDAGFTIHLGKPITPADLTNAIADAMVVGAR